MKTFIDYKVIQKVSDISLLVEDSSEVVLDWTAFLECLGLRSLLEKFPKFDTQNTVFLLVRSFLASTPARELLIQVYDQIFVECLTQVKSLLEMGPSFFIDQIQKKKRRFPFAKAFDRYERSFLETPYDVMHDLTLYLAWDRMCIYLASLFDEGLLDVQIFKECLIESFQHIVTQGKTTPGLFRLMEALYSYYLREENIQIHTDLEWLSLSQGSRSLLPREELISVPYIDSCIISSLDSKEIYGRVLTMDSMDVVKSGLALSQCIIEKLQKESLGWQCFLAPMEIRCVKECESGFKVDVMMSNSY